MKRVLRMALAAAALLAMVNAGAAPWVRQAGGSADFGLVRGTVAAPVVYAEGDASVVAIAARDLAADITRVTGRTPAVQPGATGPQAELVLVGTLGHSPAIDALAASGKLDLSGLRGAWESFIIATVEAPSPGIGRALVIAGSDPRGTAFGIYELSQAIGVSPWYWWADVAPEHKDALFVTAGTRRFGPPSVKYRGIFINDEDWGLQPWAAKTFEPENGGIGPKTYAKVFELLLRLKANTLWPAMHECTKPFNSFPQNAALADKYAIVMGSSHAEPMLRNNVGEWTAPHESYNYVTNADGVRDYWEQRLVTNGGYENLYTLGMRGIHDSHMQGPKSDAERIGVLERIFSDQRAMLARHARADAGKPPQIFCAYKEVLGLYRQGLKVPDDVTIVWPDDNFGYVRGAAQASERQRAGGFGVYYHLSYLGAPLSYLWLSTTPPALVWEEMTKAYEAGARNVWIANVGDLKPAEIGTEFFLQMAWDIKRWSRTAQEDYLEWWAAREFGAAHAGEIRAIMDGYYRLNFQRRPEHLQWWLPKEAPRRSPLTDTESAARLKQFARLRHRVDLLRPEIPAARQDAFFELVGYPVTASALANVRFLEGELGNHKAAADADAQLTAATSYWDKGLAGGKWRHIMSQEPADQQWRSMRIAPWTAPTYPARPVPTAPECVIAREAENFTGRRAGEGAAWEVVPGLGRTGVGSMAIFPASAASVAGDRVASAAARLDYALEFPAAGTFPLHAYLLPTHPLTGSALRFAVSLDDGAPQMVALEVGDGGAAWAQGVLDGARVASTGLPVPSAGKHTLHLYGVDAGVVIDKLAIDCGGMRPSYLGPSGR